MLGTLARLTLSSLAALGVGSLSAAQMCPDQCPASYPTSTVGAFQPGDMVTLVPTALTNAQSALLGVIGGGFVCNTCVPCSVKLTISWRIVTNSCVSYADCGLLQNGPGSGSVGTTLTRNCNEAPLHLRLDYGTCNPSPVCPPPVVFPAAWTLTSTFTCGDCQ